MLVLTSVLLLISSQVNGWTNEMVPDSPFDDVTSHILHHIDSSFDVEQQISSLDANVVSIEIISQEIHQFPPNFLANFENLEDLRIKNSNLRTIVQENLKHFPNLMRLSLEGNKIEKLEANLFALSNNLRQIELQRNPIKFIDATVFENLNLKVLNLEGESCVNKNAVGDSEIYELKKKVAVKCGEEVNKRKKIMKFITKSSKTTESQKLSENLKFTTSNDKNRLKRQILDENLENTTTDSPNDDNFSPQGSDEEFTDENIVKITQINIKFNSLPVIDSKIVQICTTLHLNDDRNDESSLKIELTEQEKILIISIASLALLALLLVNFLLVFLFCRRKKVKQSYKCEILGENREILKRRQSLRQSRNKRKSEIPTPPVTKPKQPHIYENTRLDRIWRKKEIEYTEVEILNLPEPECHYGNLQNAGKRRIIIKRH